MVGTNLCCYGLVLVLRTGLRYMPILSLFSMGDLKSLVDLHPTPDFVYPRGVTLRGVWLVRLAEIFVTGTSVWDTLVKFLRTGEDIPLVGVLFIVLRIGDLEFDDSEFDFYRDWFDVLLCLDLLDFPGLILARDEISYLFFAMKFWVFLYCNYSWGLTIIFLAVILLLF